MPTHVTIRIAVAVLAALAAGGVLGYSVPSYAGDPGPPPASVAPAPTSSPPLPPVTISAETPGSGPRYLPVSTTIARCLWQLADDQSILGHETWPYTDTQGRTWHLYRRDCGTGIEWTAVVDQPPGELVDQAIWS